jgi:predicted metal-dependent hydrolase
MHAKVELGNITIDVVRKDIKNVHLSVHPPSGRVTISAPSRMTLDTLRVFAISKLAWIRQQQHKLQEQERETQREYLDRESHYAWGRRYLLKVIETDQRVSVELSHGRIVFRVHPETTRVKRQAILEEWYREQIKQAVPPLFAKWAPIIGVLVVPRLYVQRMKTKWGSCNSRARNIRLNTELAKKPRECLEYVVVHEMLHLLEATHNRRFVALMDQFMPKWQFYRDSLNHLPIRHETWNY